MRPLCAIGFWVACVALMLAAVPSRAAQLTSADFDIGFGATEFGTTASNTWTTSENTTNNTPTTQGFFSFSPAPFNSRFDGSGPTFATRTLANGSGNIAGYTGISAASANGLLVPIQASYSGLAPGDASATPNYQLMIEITQISIYGGSLDNGVTTLGWDETTAGHLQSSPNVSIPVGGSRNLASSYAQSLWNPPDYSTSLALLNDSFTRTFGIANRLNPNDLRYVDGMEIKGRVHLIYDAEVIPEPSSMIMAGLAALGLTVCRGWRRRK